MASDNKSALLRRQQANEHLNSPLLQPMARDDKDLSYDGVQARLDERIIDAAAAALDDGQTHYVDVPGIAPLRAAVAEHLRDSAAGHYQASTIVITAGMQEARFLSMQMIGENFDSIALPAALDPGARKALGTRERQPSFLPVAPARGYLPSVDAIAQAAADGCRLFYLESPARLSGAVYTAAEVAAISQIAADNDATVIWDQGLAPWVAGAYASLAALDSDCARTAAIGELASGMGLASWFIGYIAAPAQWIAALQSQKQIMAICTSTAAQYAALGASEIYSELQAPRLSALGALRAELAASAAALGIAVVPGAAQNILCLQVTAAQRETISAAGFAYADGSHFGAPEVIRLAVNDAAAAALGALT